MRKVWRSYAIPSEVMKHFPATFCVVIQCLVALALPSWGQVPQTLNYQGRVAVEGINFDSTSAGHDGLFRFALVNGDGTETYWSNDGTSVAGSEPAAALTVPVSKGLYSVLLGEAGMSPLGPAVFTHADVRLRVWFDDGTHGSQMLAPDQRIAAVAYALVAGTVADGAVTGAKIVPGAIGSTHLGSDAVLSGNIAPGAVGNAQMANPSITITTGTGLAGGGALPLGGALTLRIPDGGIGSSLLAPGAALANLGTTATPTFASATFLNSGADQNKPALTLDRGVVPKGRVTFQKSSEEPGWSGLVFSINADWDNANGYQYDDGGRSQSIMQLEYEWLAPGGYRQNEFNWTSSGRRIWAHYCRTDDSTKAGVNFGAAMSIVVPEIDTTDFAALQVESLKQEGSATQVIIQNNNTATPAAAAAINLRGVGSLAPLNGWSSDWQLGTDRWWTGTNNFYILDGKADGTKERLFIDQTGKIGINNTAPVAQLDVTGAVNVSGTVNATNFTVNGGALPSLAKQSISRFAAELTNYYGSPDTVTSFLLTPSSQVADGAFVIKLLSLSPDQWRGRKVKLQMIVGVNGSSGGNLACSLAIAYRNTAMDGVNGSGYNVGDSEGSLNNTVMVVAAPTIADKLLLIESPEMTIPANITALSGGFGLQRTSASDTNTDVAFIVECRVIEQ